MEKYIAEVAAFITLNDVFSKDHFGYSKKAKAHLDDICPGFLMIFDLEKFHTLYFNSSIKEFLGVSSEKSDYSFDFWMKMLHPVSLNTVDKQISKYKTNTENLQRSALLVQSASKGKYTWIYTNSKVISYNEENRPKLVCMVGFDIEEFIKNKLETPSDLHITNLDTDVKITQREKNILKCICEEFTSKEIAAKLLISEATVESDRKSMIKKLGVKSMVGLVKFAIYNGLC